MKQLIFTVAILVAACTTNAQSPTKTEGAHQSEYNAKQHEVDGETGPSKRLPDARDVSASNETTTDSTLLTTEENTMAPVADTQAALDGTGNMPQASLNVAGSPIPGPSRGVAEKKPASRAAISPAPVRRQGSPREKPDADTKGKKKRKR